ncbi:chorismate mutase [Saccharopolyspora rosea]|uniref:Chorismate mutase n=1 Tax=Saccharopolyspora rosea TaxID=524884 RepID=A0ABW3FK43_9PSEU|nr:chorismate mutase [Saccharopolyspora rosea]
MRLRWVGGVVAVIVAGGVAAGVPASAARAESLDPLVRSAAERVATSDQVAAAKWGTGQPIDDPAREQQVLDGVARRSVELGLDPEETERVFRDQIEASKLVQRGLQEYWAAHPDRQPTERPDLGRVRPEIDRLNDELLTELRDTEQVREHASCGGRLLAAYRHVDADMRLDALHRAGLGRALPSVCGG